MNMTTPSTAMPEKNNGLCLKALLFLSATCGYMIANAAVETANVSANIISTISITNQSVGGLAFGDISSSSTAGTVVLTASGTRTATGGVTINSSATASPAVFDVQGDANTTYAISLPVSVVLTDAASRSMVVDNLTSSPSTTGLLDSTGKQILFVGASLNVGSNQAFGSYSGQMSVTVDYN